MENSAPEFVLPTRVKKIKKTQLLKVVFNGVSCFIRESCDKYIDRVPSFDYCSDMMNNSSLR